MQHVNNVDIRVFAWDNRSTHALDESCPNLGALGVQGDANGSEVNAARFKACLGLTNVLDGFTMVL